MLRTLTLAALLGASITVPAAAQGRNDDHYAAAERMADDWADLDRVDAVGDVMEAMTRALLSMPVGPLADAAARIDPDSDLADLPPDATMADLAGEDEDMPARMGDEARRASHAMAGVTRDVARMLPLFEAMAN